MNNTLSRMPLPQTPIKTGERPKEVVGKVHPLLVTPVRFISFDFQRWAMEKVVRSTFAEAMADGGLDFLYDRWLQIEIIDLKLVWYLTLESAGPKIAEGPLKPHAVIRGNLKSFVTLINQQEDSPNLFLKRRLMVRGDRAMGLAVKQILCHTKLTGIPQKAAQIVQKCMELVEVEDKTAALH